MKSRKSLSDHWDTAEVVSLADRLGLFAHKRTLQRWIVSSVLPRPVRLGRHALHPPLTILRLLALADLPPAHRVRANLPSRVTGEASARVARERARR